MADQESAAVIGAGLKAVEALVAKYRAAQFTTASFPETPEEVPLAVLPEGLRLEGLKGFFQPYRTRPERREGTAILQDLGSFAALMNRCKDEHSALFCDLNQQAPKLRGVVDYHEAGPIGEKGQRWCGHQLHYAFPFSDKWKAWVENNDTLMDQETFAYFLENQASDLVPPPLNVDRLAEQANDVLRAGDGNLGGLTADERLCYLAKYKMRTTIAEPKEVHLLAGNLEVFSEERVKSVTHLGSGQKKVVFDVTHKDGEGNELVIPGLFLIAIPLFQGAERFRLLVRLRYRKVNGTLRFGYDIHEPAESLEFAIREAAGKVAEETALPLYFGRPETT